MGLWDNVYVYAGPMPGPLDSHPWGPYTPPQPPIVPMPLTPERAQQAIDAVMRKLDEFECMRALDALDDDARARVLEWLKTRCQPRTPGGEK